MTTALPDPTLGFFKLIVTDIDAVETFYTKAFGFERVDLINLPTLEERVLKLPGGKATLVLYRHKDGRALTVGTAHGPVGIVTRKVDDFHAAALAAGGREKLAPMKLGPMRLSFVLDPEGHEVELIDTGASAAATPDAALTARWHARIDSGDAYAEAALWEDYLALPAISAKEIIGDWRGGKFDGGTTPDPINWHGKRFTSRDDVKPLLVKKPDGTIGVFEKLGSARLREVAYQGVVSATLIYNNHPITDYFRKIDDDTIIGWGEVTGGPEGSSFFFWLKREK